MHTVQSDDFLKWAAGAGIAFDSRSPESTCLTFEPPRRHARFWVLPGDPAAWPYLIGSFLTAMDKWSNVCLWPRSRRWPTADGTGFSGEGVRDVVLRGAGVPAGWQGALRFGEGESASVAAIVFVYLAFGGNLDDDLFVIPDHGRQIMQTDHHDVIHVECRSAERLRRFIDHMAGDGYELPTVPPDETFIWPAWMGPEHRQA